MEIVHLNVQSAYSLLDSTVRMEQLVAAAKEQGMRSIALTDRNVLYGAIPFYKVCVKQGVKPIIGLMADVLHEDEPYPLLLLAKNGTGYNHLLKISSSIQTKSKQGIPLRWLRGYREGLIAATPGGEGLIEGLLAAGEADKAREQALAFAELFGNDNFYLALQGFKEDAAVEQGILTIASETGIRTAAIKPIRYMKKEDALSYEVVKALRAGTTFKEGTPEGQKDYSFPSAGEMAEIFRDHPDALFNTVRIADRCNVAIPFHQRLLPKYPSDIPADKLLAQICEEGFLHRYPEAPKAYRDRLHYELGIIGKMNFCDYFLIVWDFMKFARKQKILTGPGRGSAAGSMVAYVLQITDIDPMEHNLLFERFLNPERVSMPDIDIDFSDIRRDEVIAYVAKKYGELHVAQIITFGTFAAKAALRDTGRVFGLNAAELDRLSRMVPSRLGITIGQALEEEGLREYYAAGGLNKRLIDTAMRIEGLPRHTSTHAAGVVISDAPLTESIAIQEGHDGIHLTQFPMDDLEELGLLKMDFLGLRNLSLMERVLHSIRRASGRDFNLSAIPMDDQQTLEMLAKGDTTGIFQFESEGMQKVLRQLKPERFQDLVAVNALYRPGPMENIPSYIRRRHGEEKVAYLHPDLKGILENTYGIIVYQEQIMQIASRFAGFSLGQADLLRRAVSKKKLEVLNDQRHLFVSGCLKQGYEERTANDIYDYIVKFANYGFNLSHAAAYSFIAYQLSYLKAHYPQYFMAALMSSVIGNDSKIGQYARELKKMNISLLPPSINRSGYPFQPEKEGIRYSLAAIKNVGGTAVKAILRDRKEKRFTDLFDFCIRVDDRSVNRKVLESLIHAGAFDEWGEDRATLLASLDVATDHADLVQKDDLFSSSEFNLKPKYVEMEPIPLEEKLQKEKEVLGIYISNHPVSSQKELFTYFGTSPLFTVMEAKEKKYAAGVYISEEKTIRTKKGEQMAFLTISDESDEMEAVVFPALYKNHRMVLVKGNTLLLQGYTETRADRKQFVVQAVFTREELQGMREQSPKTLYVKVAEEKHSQDILLRMKQLMRRYPGGTRLKLYLEKENRTVQLPMWSWVNPAESLIEELGILLGEENVIITNV